MSTGPSTMINAGKNPSLPTVPPSVSLVSMFTVVPAGMIKLSRIIEPPIVLLPLTPVLSPNECGPAPCPVKLPEFVGGIKISNVLSSTTPSTVISTSCVSAFLDMKNTVLNNGPDNVTRPDVSVTTFGPTSTSEEFVVIIASGVNPVP